MFNKLTKNQSYFLLFVAYVISRAASSIYYIEDIDSLRFALSLDNYSITKLQPHFPGYPVFCFIANILFSILGSKGVTFSLIGALSIFLINYYILKISKIEINNRIGIFCSFLIFFNPMIWLMSNRYMPDLMGLALSVSCLYYLTEKRSRINNLSAGCFLIGILSGVRLSYVPLVIIPFFYHLIFHNKRSYLLMSFILGCILWLLPLILMTGFENLYIAANKQSVGHFTNFGGTIITENNYFLRIINLFRSIWADGLGGFWPGRGWPTLVLSIFYIYFVYYGIKGLKKYLKYDKNLLMIIYCMFLYIIWIFLFQNMIYKSRHVMPILLILFILATIGQKYITNPQKILLNVLSTLFFISLITITSTVVIQHKNPTAISKLKDDLISDRSYKTVISTPLINYYLERHGLKGDFIDIENIEQIRIFNSSGKDTALLIGNFENLFGSKYEAIHDTTYFHNPYVNRMWSAIETFKLEKK